MDLREYDIEDLWKEIGVIFQDFMRYDMTAGENIAIGRIEEPGQYLPHSLGGAKEPCRSR